MEHRVSKAAHLISLTASAQPATENAEFSPFWKLEPNKASSYNDITAHF